MRFRIPVVQGIPLAVLLLVVLTSTARELAAILLAVAMLVGLTVALTLGAWIVAAKQRLYPPSYRGVAAGAAGPESTNSVRLASIKPRLSRSTDRRTVRA